MDLNTKRVRLGCLGANVTMSVVGTLSSLLFLTFRGLYDISYSLLGLLVFINFATQLIVDLIFSFFSHKFNVSKAVKLSPFLGAGGLIFYALAPFLFKNSVYLGIALGTVFFSAASGLNEVLISPLIAALPSDNPDREMSKTHSVYAWGVVAVVAITTLFLQLFGHEYWFILPLFFSVVPLFSAAMFLGAKLPVLSTPKQTKGALSLLKNKSVLLMVAAIFVGGACELTMTQWCSGYLEQALGISKIWGDIFGAAGFALMLGLGRSLYAKYGKNLEKLLFFSGVGTACCYLVCILSPLPIFGLIACALTGFFVSMIWPGCLVVAANRITTGGVFIYAMMAAGGDFGAALAPQLTGIIADAISNGAFGANLAQKVGLSVESLAMKAGLCVGLFFALLSIVIFLNIWRSQAKKAKTLPLAEGEKP